MNYGQSRRLFAALRRYQAKSCAQQVQEFHRHSSTNGYIIFIAARAFLCAVPLIFFIATLSLSMRGMISEREYISRVRAVKRRAYKSAFI
jgi:hypothetical protein